MDRRRKKLLGEVKEWQEAIDDTSIDSRFGSPETIVQLMVVSELRSIHQQLINIHQQMPDGHD